MPTLVTGPAGRPTPAAAHHCARGWPHWLRDHGRLPAATCCKLGGTRSAGAVWRGRGGEPGAVHTVLLRQGDGEADAVPALRHTSAFRAMPCSPAKLQLFPHILPQPASPFRSLPCCPCFVQWLSAVPPAMLPACHAASTACGRPVLWASSSCWTRLCWMPQREWAGLAPGAAVVVLVGESESPLSSSFRCASRPALLAQ